MALRLPKASVFGELDALLGLCSDRHREHGKALAADLSRTLDGATQCHQYAATLLTVDDSDSACLSVDHKGKPNGQQLFAELDGMMEKSDTVAERVAAPRLSPFMKEVEALMAKVANDSSALHAKHQAELSPAPEEEADESAGRDILRTEEEEERPQSPPLQMTAECTEPLFAELESLLHEAPEQSQERRALETSLAKVVSSTQEGKVQAASAAEQLLHGEDVEEDPAYAAWRKSALEMLKGESSSKRGPAQTASSTSSAKPAQLGSTSSAKRRSTLTGYFPPASRGGARAMSCSG